MVQQHTYLLLLLSVLLEVEVIVAVLLSSCCHALCLFLPYMDLGAEVDSWAEPDVGVAVEALKGRGFSGTAGVLKP